MNPRMPTNNIKPIMIPEIVVIRITPFRHHRFISIDVGGSIPTTFDLDISNESTLVISNVPFLYKRYQVYVTLWCSSRQERIVVNIFFHT